MVQPSRSAAPAIPLLVSLMLLIMPSTLAQSPTFITTFTVHGTASQPADITTSNLSTQPLHTATIPAETVPTNATNLPPTQAPLLSPVAPDATPANARQYGQIYSQADGMDATPTYEYFMTENPVNYTPTPSADSSTGSESGSGNGSGSGEKSGVEAWQARSGVAMVAAAVLAVWVVRIWPVLG